MKKKKSNPNRVPVSQKDVERAKKIERGRALVTTEAVFLTVMMDKFGFEDKIRDVWREVNKLSEEVKEGRVSLFDLIQVLEDEYGIEISKQLEE